MKMRKIARGLLAVFAVTSALLVLMAATVFAAGANWESNTITVTGMG